MPYFGSPLDPDPNNQTFGLVLAIIIIAVSFLAGVGLLTFFGVLPPLVSHGTAILPGAPCNCWEGAYTQTMINCLNSGNLSSQWCDGARSMLGVGP